MTGTIFSIKNYKIEDDVLIYEEVDYFSICYSNYSLLFNFLTNQYGKKYGLIFNEIFPDEDVWENEIGKILEKKDTLLQFLKRIEQKELEEFEAVYCNGKLIIEKLIKWLEKGYYVLYSV